MHYRVTLVFPRPYTVTIVRVDTVPVDFSEVSYGSARAFARYNANGLITGSAGANRGFLHTSARLKPVRVYS